jgi:hypothetical protein
VELGPVASAAPAAKAVSDLVEVDQGGRVDLGKVDLEAVEVLGQEAGAASLLSLVSQ